MREYIYPLNKVDFFKIHKNAWENGWTYGPGFEELYLDYLVNWVYFVDYLDILIKSMNPSHSRLYLRTNTDIVTIPFANGEIINMQVIDFYDEYLSNQKLDESQNSDALSNQEVDETNNISLKFLIGEAPPFWAGKSKLIDRTYYYNPSHLGSTNYLSGPYNFFTEGNGKKVTKGNDKKDKLIELGISRVIIIDVFPFPIWQKTKVRNTITDNFSWHIRNYFVDFFNNVYNYIFKNSNKNDFTNEFAFIAPIYTSIQLMYGSQTQKILSSCFKELGKIKPLKLGETISVSSISKIQFDPAKTDGEVVKKMNKDSKLEFTEMAKFLYQLIFEEVLEDTTDNFLVAEHPLEILPILISKGNPSFNTIFNSKENLKNEI